MKFTDMVIIINYVDFTFYKKPEKGEILEIIRDKLEGKDKYNVNEMKIISNIKDLSLGENLLKIKFRGKMISTKLRILNDKTESRKNLFREICRVLKRRRNDNCDI